MDHTTELTALTREKQNLTAARQRITDELNRGVYRASEEYTGRLNIIDTRIATIEDRITAIDAETLLDSAEQGGNTNQ